MRRRAGSDADDVCGSGWYVQPAISAVAPGQESGVGFHHEIFRAAGIENGGLIEAGRYLSKRAVVEIAPGNDCAIRFECSAKVSAAGDGDYVAEADRNIALAVAVPTPRNHRAVPPKGERMMAASGDGDDIVQTSRDIALPVTVIAPGSDDRGRVGYLQRDDGTGHGSVRIADDELIIPGVGGLNVGKAEEERAGGA